MSADAAAGRRSEPLRLAVFVSPHGFGHAARAAALLAALGERRPALAVTLYTTVPRWFFEESLSFPFSYRELACDVGLVQRSAVEEDLPGTVRRLEKVSTETKGFHLGELVSEVRESGAVAVLCDISPLGLQVATEAGLHSILVENFTWDWIYEPLVEREPGLAPWVGKMRELFALADLRIQAEPVCVPLDGSDSLKSAQTAPHLLAPSGTAPAPPPPSTESFSSFVFRASKLEIPRSGERGVVRVAPIARRPRSSVAAVRERLGLAPEASGRPMILVSMGGIEWSYSNFDRLRVAEAFDFVVPGGAAEERHEGNLRLLPHHSPVYHPDLVAACDALVGKLGYSTVAEAVRAGTRYLFPPRPGFREHPVLADYVRERLPSVEVPLAELAASSWVERLPDLVGAPRARADVRDGAAEAAAAVSSWLGR